MSNQFVPSTHQAAGHVGCLVSPNNGTVFAKKTTKQEIEFYTQTQILLDGGSVDNSPLGSHLSDWMPVYMGILTSGDITSQVGPTSDLKQPPIPTFLQDQHQNEQYTRKQSSGNHIVPPIEPVPIVVPQILPLPPQAPASDGKDYIVLQNLYHGFSKPSILDIKLGRILYDENASPEKRERLTKVANSTTSGSLGFRICGMKLYHSSIDHPSSSVDVPQIFPEINDTITVVPEPMTQSVYLEFNKFFGRTLNASNVKQGLLLYFSSTQLSPDLILKLIEKFLQRLQVLYNCLLDSNARMIASSLLFVYENDKTRWSNVESNIKRYDEVDPLLRDDFFADTESEDDEEYNVPLSSLNIIDFAHSKYAKLDDSKDHVKYDENLVQGVENLIKIFEELVSDYKAR